MLGCLLKETRSCRKNRNTILRNGDVCSMKTNAVKTALPLVLKFHSLTYERFSDLFSVLVGGITVDIAPDIPLVFL
jgi:hypothetical protein